MQYKNLRLLGTSHIAKQSLREVRKAMEEPVDRVALELDRDRFLGLMHERKRRPHWRDIKRIGFKGFLFSLFGEWAERKLGEQVGTKPGDEMRLAAQFAAERHVPIVLIDRRIDRTLKRLSQAITWKEKWHMLVDIIKGIFQRKPLPFALTAVPSQEVLERLTGEVRERYPNVYRVLVEERNEIMARRLKKLMEDYPEEQILAIVGAGHAKEILRLIK